MKTCSHCGKVKPESEFYPRHSRRGRPNAVSSQCKTCMAILARQRYHKTDPSHITQQKRKYALRNYGISQQEYENLLEEQNWVCKTCGQPETKLHPATHKVLCLSVDHDHQTGRVRGLLCHRCNMALGLVHDDPEILSNMIEHLKE
jgi:hypothetical protein